MGFQSDEASSGSMSTCHTDSAESFSDTQKEPKRKRSHVLGGAALFTSDPDKSAKDCM